MWGLSDALALIREIQPTAKALSYHVALAGSVLNVGESVKDLDLVFLPLTNETRPEVGTLTTWLSKMWGEPQDNVTDPNPCVSLRYQASYVSNGKRIDVFVV